MSLFDTGPKLGKDKPVRMRDSVRPTFNTKGEKTLKHRVQLGRPIRLSTPLALFSSFYIHNVLQGLETTTTLQWDVQQCLKPRACHAMRFIVPHTSHKHMHSSGVGCQSRCDANRRHTFVLMKWALGRLTRSARSSSCKVTKNDQLQIAALTLTNCPYTNNQE